MKRLLARLAGRQRATAVSALVLVFALAGTVLAGSGRYASFNLGVVNTINGYVTTLKGAMGGALLQLTNTSTSTSSAGLAVTTSGGTGVKITVPTGRPPIVVNSAAGKATNLNADKLDGKNAADFLPAAGKAVNADKLDGIDSSELQKKLTGNCPADSSIRAITQPGAVTCEADDINGGDAQTLDGKDSADFAEAAHDHEISTDTVTGEGNNATDGTASGNLKLLTVGRENLVLGVVSTAQLAGDAVTTDKVSEDDLTNLTSNNIRTGTLRGTLTAPPGTAAATGGDIALGTISGQGDNDDVTVNPLDDGAITGNLGLGTVGRANLVNGAIDATKVSSTFLGDLVTEAELARLANRDPDGNGISAPNDAEGFVHWNNLFGIPIDFADGDDDDGATKVQQLKANLATDDGTPNQNSGSDADLVSFSEIKDLTTSGGNGRITGTFIADGSLSASDLGGNSVESAEIKDGTITAADLAGDDVDDPGVPGDDRAPGAVTSAKIADGSIETRDVASAAVTIANLGSDVIDRFEALEDKFTDLADPTRTSPAVAASHIDAPAQLAVKVNPPSIPQQTRTAATNVVTVPIPLRTTDIVTVSPPAGLDQRLLFVGSDVLVDGTLTVYLFNTSTTTAVDDVEREWTVRYLNVVP